KGLGKNIDELITKEGPMDAYDAALAYYTGSCMEDVVAYDTTDNDIQNIKREIRGKFMDGTYKREAEKLSNNPVFKEQLKQNKRFDYKEWRRIEKESDRMLESCINEVAAFKADDMKLKNYIFAGNLRENDQKQNDAVIEKRFNHLGKYVLKQILKDPVNKVTLNAIAAGKLSCKEVVKDIVTVFKNKNISLGNSFSFDELKSRIDSGELKNMVLRNLTKKTQESAKRVPIKGVVRETIEPKSPAIPKMPNMP
ncbi:MAG: hypothetical protein K6G11_10170, partial [Lachnospiraceae bacterium]|nr:hypothetical protein [Lachnospiraceae bacterium]